MLSKKDAVVLAVIPFLVIMLVCSLVTVPVLFAEVKKGPIGCTPLKNSQYLSGPGLIECCQTTTDSEGIEITKCTVCDDTNPPSNCTTPTTPLEGSGASNIGTIQPPSTPPPPSNETHVNNQPGHIGTKQSLTTTCPDGSTPDINGSCTTATTSTTNPQGESASNNNDNNNPQQGHHHKGNNPST